jgi:hypothetical protein
MADPRDELDEGTPARIIEGFPKNPTEVVVGEINEWKGRRLAHIRTMRAAVEEGGWVRGPGVAIDADRVGEILDGVRKLRDVVALDKVVAEIPLEKEAILIGVQPFKGNQYAYIRRFYRSKEGEWAPTKRGVNVRTEFIDELIELVERVAVEAAEGRSTAR